MAQTGVSGPVVVDGESFLDALFASAGQGWGTRQHRLQVEERAAPPVRPLAFRAAI